MAANSKYMLKILDFVTPFSDINIFHADVWVSAGYVRKTLPETRLNHINAQKQCRSYFEKKIEQCMSTQYNSLRDNSE